MQVYFVICLTALLLIVSSRNLSFQHHTDSQYLNKSSQTFGNDVDKADETIKLSDSPIYNQEVRTPISRIEGTEGSPLFSILVAVYNVHSFVEECLDSILKQTFTDYEVIIIDDGSTDGSGEIVDKYAVIDKRFNVVHLSENKGLFNARKEGVSRATGKYCMFLDSDDYYPDNDTLQVAASNIPNYPVDIIHYPLQVVGRCSEVERQWFINWASPSSRQLVGAETIIKECFIERQFNWGVVGKVFNTSICKHAYSVLPDHKLVVAEDALGLFVISYFSNIYVSIKTKPLYNYRYGFGSTTSGIGTLKTFQRFLIGEQIALQTLEIFLLGNRAERIHFEALRALKELLFSSQISRFLRLNEADMSSAFDLLTEYHSEIRILERIIQGSGAQGEKLNHTLRSIIFQRNSRKTSTIKIIYSYEKNLPNNQKRTSEIHMLEELGYQVILLPTEGNQKESFGAVQFVEGEVLPS